MLSRRAKALKPSPTMAMANKARELAAKGHDVVSLTVGEPDWPTFQIANQAAIKAIEEGFTRYTAASGIPELRNEIAQRTSGEVGVSYTANQVVVGAGAKFIIYALLQMLVDEGDEVLIPSPYWVSYPTMTELAGAQPRIIECGLAQNFKLQAEQLEKAITAKTKVLILCSPSNPTGLLYNREELLQLAQVIRRHPQLIVISDDIYDKLVFQSQKKNLIEGAGGIFRAPHLLSVAPDLKEQVIIVNGASKTFSMTGWRVGWALGAEPLMKVTADFMSQSTSNVTSISQKAALAALQGGVPELKTSVQKLEIKRDRMFEKFQSLKHFKVIPPDGAFYFWVKVDSCFGKKIPDGKPILNSKELADLLLEKYFVATVPGIEFGSEGYLRLSIAASDKQLDQAYERFLKFESDLI
jgi:aspartate aminotransferase